MPSASAAFDSSRVLALRAGSYQRLSDGALDAIAYLFSNRMSFLHASHTALTCFYISKRMKYDSYVRE